MMADEPPVLSSSKPGNTAYQTHSSFARAIGDYKSKKYNTGTPGASTGPFSQQNSYNSLMHFNDKPPVKKVKKAWNAVEK